VGRMVALGIESGGKRQHLRGTELHAEAARLTSFHDDGNTTFRHGTPTGESDGHSKPKKIMSCPYRSRV